MKLQISAIMAAAIALTCLLLLVVVTPAVAQVKATPKIDSVLGGHLPNAQIGIYTTPKYDRNEITATPNQTAPFKAGYSQGFLNMPLKGHHSPQFLLGYINGTQGMLNDKAEVAGVLGLRFHGNNQSMVYYKQGKGIHDSVKRGAEEPIGTLPDKTNDNYMQFFIGYDDGAILRDNSDPSGNYPHFGDCPSGQTSEFCAGWKFGWNNEEVVINPSSSY